MSAGRSARTTAAYAPDRTFLPHPALKRLLKELPTPFYLYDARGLRAAVHSVYDAFSWNEGFTQYFPLRLNASPAILSLLREEGCGALCDNPSLLARAKQCGFAPEKLLCTAAAGAEDCAMILDGAHDLPAAPPSEALLRFNPGGKLSLEGRVLASLDRVRLGMPEAELHRLAAQLRLFGTAQIGLSFQALSGDLRPEYYPAVAKLLFEAALRLSKETGIPVASCCLGDGLGVSGRPEFPPPSIAECGARIRALYDSLLTPNGLGKVRLKTSLGRRLIAEHAIFVTSVRAVKQRTKPLLLVDAAGSQFSDMGPLAGKHHISVAGKASADGRIVCDVAGCQSEAYGYFAEGCILPPVRPGDALVFHTAGAVASGWTPGSGFPPAAQYLLREDGSVEPIEGCFTTW